MGNEQQPAINLGPATLSAAITTDGAGAITRVAGAGTGAATFVTDGTDGLINVALLEPSAVAVPIASGITVGTAFFVIGQLLTNTNIRLTCLDNTGAVAIDLSAVVVIINLIAPKAQ